MKRIHFISQKDLIRIINLEDINLWNYIYNEHMKWLKNQTLNNTFYYVILELYKELNKHINTYIKNKNENTCNYIGYKFVSVYPKNIEGINKMFISPKTKSSLEKYFVGLGYKFCNLNMFGKGDSISIHF